MSSSRTIISVKQSPKTKTPKIKRKAAKKRTLKRRSNDRDCYARILNDPFNSLPCKIGYGTMVPTLTGTMFFRQSILTHADGSLAVFAIPSLSAAGGGFFPFYFTNAGAPVAAWAGTSWNNIGQYPTTVTDSCRILSVGIRMTPLVSANSVPGICFAGNIAGETVNEVVAYSPSTLGALSSLKNFVTSNNVIEVHSRPIDNAAYEFTPVNYAGSNNAEYPHSFPVIALTGYPATSSVLVEAICHFEYIPVTTVTNVRSTNADIDPDENKISSNFPSWEDMWRYTSQHLNPSAVVDFGASALNLMNARSLNGLLRGGGQQRLN